MADVTRSNLSQRLRLTAPSFLTAVVLGVLAVAASPASAFTGPIQTLAMHTHLLPPKALSPSQKASLVATQLKLNQPKLVPAGVMLSAAQPYTASGHSLSMVKPLAVSGDPGDSFIMLSGMLSAVVVKLKTSPGETYVLDVAMSHPGNLAYSYGQVGATAPAQSGHALIVVSSSKSGGSTSVSMLPTADVTMVEISSIEVSKLN